MLICKRCHGTFENPAVIIERHGLEISPYEYEEICPACKYTDLVEAKRCHCCNAPTPIDEINNGFCESCATKIVDRFKYLLRNEFDEHELKLLDNIVEGTGIADPSILKI